MREEIRHDIEQIIDRTAKGRNIRQIRDRNTAKTGCGSYGIKLLGKHRIARVQEMKKGGYKCTCDDEKSRRIFDKVKVDYISCPGFKYKNTDFRALYLDRQEDMRAFLMKVIHEYLLIVND